MKVRSFFKLSAIARLSLGLIALVISLLLIADMVFGVIPDQQKIEREVRQRFAEALAVQLVALLQTGDDSVLANTLQEVAIRNPDIVTIGIRKADGDLLFQRGDHLRFWISPESGRSTINHIRVPIYSKQVHWGDIEISFKPNKKNSFLQEFTSPLFRLIAVLGLVGGGLIYIYMRRAMQYLDPSVAVPGRVHKAFDILTEGILVLDKSGRIVLINQAFKELNHQANEEMYGKKISDLALITPLVEQMPSGSLPWELALKNKVAVKEEHLTLVGMDGTSQDMVVSCEPIVDEDKSVRGYLVTFKNITELHKTNQQLKQALDELEIYRLQIEEHNEELQMMATRDQLTGCLNRRALFEQGEDAFASAVQGNKELFCIMADIDFFKSINDLHGHFVGDQALRAVSKICASNLRPSDIFSRYGGEEFCIILIDLSIHDVLEVAERMRKAIEATACTSIRNVDVKTITMSFGVASLRDGANNLSELIEQADGALYKSKESGRNCVTVWKQAKW